MSPPDRAPRRVLALDSCALLNLAGAGVGLSDVADALTVRFVVAAVAAAEALFVEDDVDGERVRIPVDVTRWEKTGEIGVVPLDPAELAVFVALTRDLDDGEAATLALARSRGYLVVTDDRKALRLAGHHGCAVLGTAGLLRQWAQAVGLPTADVGTVLRHVERRARFSPRRRDPDHDWWTRCTAAR